MLHQIKASQFYTNFLKFISLVMQSSSRIVTFTSVFFISFQSLKTVGKSYRSTYKVLEFYTKLACMNLVLDQCHVLRVRLNYSLHIEDIYFFRCIPNIFHRVC